jgi:hypothetical protein
MGPVNLEKVLEKLATTDKATLVFEKAPEGKVRVTASTWASENVILKGEVLEVRNVDGQVRVARKAKHHDDRDPPIEPYEPYGPGEVVSADVSDEFADD